MSALSSFYLLFTCVVTFFFAVKGGLDRQMSTSEGLRPSWSYVLTVGGRRRHRCSLYDSCFFGGGGGGREWYVVAAAADPAAWIVEAVAVFVLASCPSHLLSEKLLYGSDV